MKTIKYRFYLKENGTGLIFTKTFDFAAIFSGTAKRFFNEQHPDSFLIAKVQYTGLPDRTGKEIYEGDIIEIKHPFKERYFKGIVEYVDYKFMVKGFCFTHFDNPTDIFSEGTEYIEVVSNIHENPELLK